MHKNIVIFTIKAFDAAGNHSSGANSAVSNTLDGAGGGEDANVIYIGSNSSSFPTDVCNTPGDLSDKYILDESISLGTIICNDIDMMMRFNGGNRWWYSYALSSLLKLVRMVR